MTWHPRRTSANKYGAKPAQEGGRSFASQLERAVYRELSLMERAGAIRDLQAQDHVYLTDARIAYVADFKFYDTTREEWIWAEAKGLELPVWRLKRRLWIYYGPGRLQIFKAARGGVAMVEELTPKHPKIQKLSIAEDGL